MTFMYMSVSDILLHSVVVLYSSIAFSCATLRYVMYSAVLANTSVSAAYTVFVGNSEPHLRTDFWLNSLRRPGRKL